jgi:hypothetical protein
VGGWHTIRARRAGPAVGALPTGAIQTGALPTGTFWALSLSLVALSAVIASCGNDDGNETQTVDHAEAITAIIAWQADEQEPVVDDNGEEQLPVIFVAADAGATIDVGVQAEVAAATVDWATVRFADDTADTFDPDLDGEPVRDDGVLLLIGPMPDPAQMIELDLVRYRSVDDSEAITLEIASNVEPVGTGPDAELRAIVTTVTRP